METAKRMVFGAIAVGVVAAWFLATQREEGVAAGRQPVASPHPAPTSQPSQSEVSTVAKPGAAARSSNVAVNVGAQIDALGATGNAQDAFAAYKLARDCANARAAEVTVAHETNPRAKADHVHWPKPGEACVGVTPGQIASRLTLLEVAARAGVPGALGAYAAEGPEGRGTANVNPHDPAVIHWRAQMTEMAHAGARTGDTLSLVSLVQFYDVCLTDACANRNPAKALMYHTALAELEKARTGKELPNAHLVAARLKEELTPSDAAAAIEEGKRLVSSTKWVKDMFFVDSVEIVAYNKVPTQMAEP